MTKQSGVECPLGGDCSDCTSCAYYPDYKFNEATGECELNPEIYGRIKNEEEY